MNLPQLTPEGWAACMAVLASVCSGLYGFYKIAILPIYNWIVSNNNKNKMISAIIGNQTAQEWNNDYQKQKEDINQILYELKPNGGASTKDAINDIRNLVRGISVDINQVKERQNVGIYLNSAPVFECDKYGGMISLNKKLLELMGVTLQEALGMGWTNQIHPEDRDRVLHQWERAIEANSEFNCTYRFINKQTNQVINVIGTSTINRDVTGEVAYIMGTFEIVE